MLVLLGADVREGDEPRVAVRPLPQQLALALPHHHQVLAAHRRRRQRLFGLVVADRMGWVD